jgi:hypothetical protein
MDVNVLAYATVVLLWLLHLDPAQAHGFLTWLGMALAAAGVP